jgi:hypothetical protein
MSDLITITNYKQAKALSKSDQDERISSIITGVSSLVKTYCNNTFNDYVITAKEEYVKISYDYQEILQVKEYPIIAVENVYEKNSPTDALTELTLDTDFVIDADTDSLVRIDAYWPKGINNVKVVYTCGYAVIPTDLQLAIIDLITYYLKEEHKKSQSIGNASRQNVSTTSLKSDTGFPDHIRRVLDLYRKL